LVRSKREVTMRYVLGFVCVLALGLMGCSETGGKGLCEGVECQDDGNECTTCSSGACLDGACTALTTVGGTVSVEDANDVTFPAVDATVSVLGTSLSTTTNERGEFSFGVFEGNWFFQSEKNALGGLIQLETVPLTPGNDIELFVWTDAFGTELLEPLEIDLDRSKGVISVNFGMAPGIALGGETAELSEPYEYSSATNANGDEVLTNALLPAGGPDLTFWNVDVTEELVVTPKWIDGTGECWLEMPEIVYPIRAGFATLRVDARCGP
jgi:hypothetical protein